MKNHQTSPAQKILLGTVLPTAFIALGVGVYVALGTAKPQQLPPKRNTIAERLFQLPEVSTAQVLPFGKERILEIDVTGVVVPFREITVAAEVTGRVLFKSDACQSGRYVQKGDLLYRIDSRDYELEAERLSRLRQQEYAAIKELDQEIANSQKLVALADEEVELLEKEISRLTSLPEGFSSDTELDESRRRRITSMNQKLTLENQVDLLNTRRVRLELAEQLAGTQLEQAKMNLARCEIVAPVSGVIITEMAEADSYLQKGATLCEIEDTSTVEVLVQIRSDQLLSILNQNTEVAASESAVPIATPDALSKNQLDANTTANLAALGYQLPKSPVTIKYAIGGAENTIYSWEGYLSRYDGLGLDSQSRTTPCRITVEQPRNFKVNGQPPTSTTGGPPALVRGMFVDASIQTKPNIELVLVPKLAFQPGNKIWKFVENASVLDIPPQATSENSSAEAKGETVVGASDSSKSDLETPEDGPIDPDDWMAGTVDVLTNVRALKLIRVGNDPVANDSSNESSNLQPSQSQEYWVVDPAGRFEASDRLITTPLANALEDGSDKVRVRRSSSESVIQSSIHTTFVP